MTIVAVSQRVDFISTHNEFRDSLDQRLIRLQFQYQIVCLFKQEKKLIRI